MNVNTKKILAIVLCLIISLSTLLSTQISVLASDRVLAQNKGDFAFNKDVAFDLFKQFQTLHPNRKGGTEEEKAAATYLANYLEEVGLSKYKGDSFIDDFSVYTEDELGEGSLSYSQNVVGVIKAKNNTDKQVIIGAHYDNVNSIMQSKSTGAYDNGSGVAVVMSLAQGLMEYDLPVNVVIVFFGMEEYGVLGSKDFAQNMTEEEKKNTLLMINVDSVSCGEYLYVYTDEIARLHEEIFFENAKKINFALTKMPKDKKTNGFFIASKSKEYYHVGLASDHASFMDEGMLVINFLGYNLQSKENVLGKEKDGYANIMHTDNDTVENIISIYGEEFVKNRLGGLCNTIVNTLLDDNFVNACENSYNNPTTISFLYTNYFNLIIVLTFATAFVVAVVVIAKKENKKMPKIVRVQVVKKEEENKEPPPDVFDL